MVAARPSTGTLGLTMTAPYWTAIGALVILVLFVANAIAYRKRRGSFFPHGGAPQSLKHSLSGTDTAIYFVMVVALLAGVAPPTVAPDTDFAVWISRPFYLVVYVVWVLFLATLL